MHSRSKIHLSAVPGTKAMNKSIKTLAMLGSGLVLLSVSVVVVNQTVQVVQLAKEVHPVFGTVTLWGLLLSYAALVGVPIVMIVRMPRPLSPPSNELGPGIREPHRGIGPAPGYEPAGPARIDPAD